MKKMTTRKAQIETIAQYDLTGKTGVRGKYYRDYADLSLALPKFELRPKNILTFKLPHATSPESLRQSIDQHQLGLAVKLIEFRRASKER